MEQIIELKKGKFWKGTCPKDGMLKITCVEGALWITQEGDGWDHCLEPGSSLALHEPGLILVESIENISKGAILYSPGPEAKRSAA